MKRILFNTICITTLSFSLSAQASPYVIHTSTESETTINSHSTTVTNTTINQNSTSTSVSFDIPATPDVNIPDISFPEISFPEINFPEISPDVHWPHHSDHRADRWLLERLKTIDRGAKPWKENRQTVLFRWKGKTIVASRSSSELTLRSWFTRTNLSHREALDRSNRWNSKTFEGHSWVTNEFEGPRFWLQWSVPIEEISDASWNHRNLRRVLEEYAARIDNFIRLIDNK